MAMTKEEIKNAAKSLLDARQAVLKAQEALVTAESVFTNDYRDEHSILGEMNIICVDGEFFELEMDIECREFVHLHRMHHAIFQ